MWSRSGTEAGRSGEAAELEVAEGGGAVRLDRFDTAERLNAVEVVECLLLLLMHGEALYGSTQ